MQETVNQAAGNQMAGSNALSAVLEDMKSGGGGSSKRRHTRHAADNLILFIAKATQSGEVPGWISFFPVRCRDLSCGGISFFLPARPSFDRLVVQLGDRVGGLFMEAQVMHVSSAIELPKSKTAWDNNGRMYEIELGAKPFQVGCQFKKRTKGPDA